MLRHITGNMEQKSEIILPSQLGDKLIPINEDVVFTSESILPDGNVGGTFEYAGELVPGVLLNVTKTNKTLYTKNRVQVPAVVRKYKNGIYNLMESHRYKKIIEKNS